MPIPTVITDLSATIASNSPSGSDTPIDGDNFIRALSGFIRQEYDTQRDTADTAKGDATLGVKRTTTGSVATTQHAWHEKQPFNVVTDFGCPTDGTSDCYTAFTAAWAAIKSTGGEIIIPPGTYTLNTQWELDVSLALPYNYKITGYGAELKAGAAVTGAAIRVYKGFNNFGVTIEGLHFNHRNNTTVGGCIQGLGAHNLRIINCAVEHHNTKAAYKGIELGPYTAGTPDTNSFWSVIDGFKTRQRSGSDGTDAAVGVQLTGAANATNIVNCTFASVTSAIKIVEDGIVAGGVANGCVISGNRFEGVGICVDVIVSPAASSGYMPPGLRILANRVETATTFVSLTTGGAAANDHSHPPIIRDNYLVSGSVTNALVNSNNQLVTVDHPRLSGLAEESVSIHDSSRTFKLDGTQSNLKIQNSSGNSGYSGAHLMLGAYHIWVESATGKLRMNSATPASDSDGTVVGTQT